MTEKTEDGSDELELTVVATDVLLTSGGKWTTTECRKSEKLEVLVKTWTWRLLTRDKTAAWTQDCPNLHIRGPPLLVCSKGMTPVQMVLLDDDALPQSSIVVLNC